MGVFLSKPSVEKFSEDGEDDSVVFGVSSMQGWRKNMEDAHVALLDVKHEGAVGAGEREGGGVPKDTSIRVFGVFDGHGGKEVALFVQEHLVEELVKLDEYKGGDFPAGLARSFHRMDEMLEGAAHELRRLRGMTPEAGGDPQGDGGEERREAETKEFGTGEGEGGVEGGGGVEGVIEERRAILHELSAFRSRKNPSDFEEPEPPNPEVDDAAARNMYIASSLVASSGGVEYDSEEEDAQGGPRGSGGGAGDGFIDVGDGTGPAEGAAMGSKGDNKTKMADALELFHRILDIRKDGRRVGEADGAADGGDGAAAAAAVTGASEGDALDGEGAGSLPLDGQDGRSTMRKLIDMTGGQDARASEEEEEEEGGRDGGRMEEEGEDTFGDSDESEEDDVVVTNGGAGEGGVGRPRLGLGASLASIVNGAEGPTCTLQDHPIQAGCTSVVCLMVEGTLHVANAGDSRAVLCRGGTAVDLSSDHKPMSDTEKSRIHGAGGFVNAVGRVNGNLNLSRSIGDLKYKANSNLAPADQMITAEPDVRSIAVTDEDLFVVLACDGVWDCMTSQECIDFVGARVGNMPLSKVCEQVMDNCLSEDPRRTTGIGGDNMTCIVVLLNKSFVGDGVSSPNKGEDGEKRRDYCSL